MKNTRYSRFINLIRKILHAIPKCLWGITSFIISALFFLILRVSGKKAQFSRIRTKVSAQYFSVASFSGIKEAETFFKRKGFKTEKMRRSLEIFPYSTEFGLKLRKEN